MSVGRALLRSVFKTSIFADADGPRDAASRLIDDIALHTELNVKCDHHSPSNKHVVSTYMLRTRLYSTLSTVDNRSSQWSLSITVHVCANNRQLSVCAAKCFQISTDACCPQGDHTRRPDLCAARYYRLDARQRRAVHQRRQI